MIGVAPAVTRIGHYERMSQFQKNDFTPSLVPEGPPVAKNDYYLTEEDVVLQVEAANGVLANDTDPNEDPLTTTILSEPLYGSLVLDSNGSFTYTPGPNWFGEDSFTYEVSDGELTDTATAYITVESVNDAPVAIDDYVETEEDTSVIIDLLANDHDVEDDPLEVVQLGYNSEWLHGTLEEVEVEISEAVS